MKKIVDCGISEYVQQRIRRNDKRWGILVLLLCVIFIGFYCQKDYKREIELNEFKLERIQDCERFKDSLINICNHEYRIEDRVRKD